MPSPCSRVLTLDRRSDTVLRAGKGNELTHLSLPSMGPRRTREPKSRSTSRNGSPFHHMLLLVKARREVHVFLYPCLSPYFSMLMPSFLSCMCMLAMFAFRTDECTCSRPFNRPVGSPIREVEPPSFSRLASLPRPWCRVEMRGTNQKRNRQFPYISPSQNHKWQHMTDMQRRCGRVHTHVNPRSFLREDAMKNVSFSVVSYDSKSVDRSNHNPCEWWRSLTRRHHGSILSLPSVPQNSVSFQL